MLGRKLIRDLEQQMTRKCGDMQVQSEQEAAVHVDAGLSSRLNNEEENDVRRNRCGALLDNKMYACCQQIRYMLE